jgi:hypothetical protein
VIAPPAVHGEIAWRVAFAPKAQPSHERDRRAVAGLDVGFEAVKPKASKRVVDHEREAFVHESLPLPRRERVIAEVAALECAVDDLADVHDADEVRRPSMADEKTHVRRPAQTAQICTIRGGRGGRRDPARVPRPAAAHRRNELALRACRRPFEPNARRDGGAPRAGR